MVQLYPRLPDASGQTWVIEQEASIGRSRDCQLQLADGRVSRHHATLKRTANGFLVRDSGSQHGTFVDGQLVSREGRHVRFGGVVRIGGVLLTLVADVEPYRGLPRRIPGSALGLGGELYAGPALAAVWDMATRTAALGRPVLILGESGTGKECIARMIHLAARQNGPFVGLNLAAVPDSLFEAELFGYERGAFTGATTSRKGAFREASGGLLFLDEMGDLSPASQAKLLRAVDLQVVRPLGASAEVPVDALLVAATSIDLEAAVQMDRFRADLLYRISEITIRVPPLRERPLDILLIAHSILAKDAPSLCLSSQAVERLVLSVLPGNVRSLRAMMTHAIAQATTCGMHEILAQHLPPDLGGIRSSESGLSEPAIRSAMLAAGGVVSKASQLLRVSRTTFYNNCRRLNIEPSSLVE